VKSAVIWAQRAAVSVALGPWSLPRQMTSRTRTGGPDDGGDELRWLMPILALVIVLAVVFGS
jgi:hypothetical protein